MSNRSGLVLVGMALAIIGYALVWSGLTTLNPSTSPTGEEVGVMDSLIPGALTSKKAA